MVRSRILRCLLLVVAVSSRIFDVALASTEQGIIQNTDSNSASSNFYESFEKQALRQKFQDKSSSQPVDPRNSKETGNFQDVLKELCKQRKSIFNEFATEPIDDERQLLSLKKLKNRKTTASLQSKQGPEGSVAPEDSIDSAVEGLPVNEVDKFSFIPIFTTSVITYMVYVDGTKPWIYLWIFNCLWYLMIAFPEKSAELRLYVNAIECRILRDLEDVTKSLESSDGL